MDFSKLIKLDETKPKKAQWIRLGIGGTLLIGGVTLLIALFAKPEPVEKNKLPPPKTLTTVTSPGANLSAKDVWMATEGKRVTEMNTRIAELEKLLRLAGPNQVKDKGESLEVADTAQASVAESGAPNATKTFAPLDKLRSDFNNISNVSKLNTNTKDNPPIGMPPGKPADLGSIAEAPNIEQRAIVSVQIAQPSDVKESNKVLEKKPEKKEDAPFLSIGVMKAEILGGIDAPTGGQSQSNPHPVLLRISGDAKLPNGFSADTTDCLIVAAGYGDISSERAYIRTETISCINEEGRALEIPLSGHVYGEDGKLGVRGTLVTKNGQLLANALMSGVASGIGRGFAQQQTSQSISPLGSTTTVDPSRTFQYGIGTGVGQALNRLANYYIRLAEKIFPVVEVGSGRLVDVAITKGTTFDFARGGKEGARRTLNGKRNYFEE